MPPTTIKQLLQQAYKRIDPLDAELLIAFVLKKTREFVIAHQDYEVRKFASAQVRKSFEKRTCEVPLSYLVGHKEFFGLDFLVNKNVLVPRPETEILVEEVLKKFVHLHTCKLVYYIDIGTGSGCIPISIIKNLQTYKLTNLQTFATDTSKSALRMAKLNAKKHSVKIKFLQGNLLTPFLNTYSLTNLPARNALRSMTGGRTYPLLITANLPYLTPRQYKNSPSIQHEPKSALVAGKTGLELYERLLKQIKQLLNRTQNTANRTQPVNRGPQLAAFFEIDPVQARAIKILIKKHLPGAKVGIKKDLSGKDRVVIISNF